MNGFLTSQQALTVGAVLLGIAAVLVIILLLLPSNRLPMERRRFSPDEAEACDMFLQKQGLIVRRVAGYKLPHCLRITIGDEASCRQVAHAVAQFKGVK